MTEETKKHGEKTEKLYIFIIENVKRFSSFSKGCSNFFFKCVARTIGILFSVSFS